MSKPKTRNKATRVAVDQKLIVGVQKHLAGAPLVLAGKTFTAAEAVQFLQERVDAASSVKTLTAAVTNAVAAEKAKVAETKKYVSALRQLVHAMFGTNAETLADFGIALHQQATPPTTEQMALRIARGKATRVARHTATPKQKAKIKGVVETPLTPIQPAATVPAAPAVTKPDAGNGAPHA
jgi:hypothetical protein